MSRNHHKLQFFIRIPLLCHNPRTYKQSHTPTWTVLQGGDGVDGPLPWAFALLQYFAKILPLIESF